MLYLAALVAAGDRLLTDTAGSSPRCWPAIVATAAYGLSERLLPGLIELERSAAAGDRLAQPLTYWNGQGALAAIGLVLAAGLIARRGPGAARGRPRPPRRPRARPRARPLSDALARRARRRLVAGLLVLVALIPTRAGVLAALLAAAARRSPRCSPRPR